ncbi:MAG: cell division protein FtsW [Marinilabiliaceae bacterium]|nr:cell division protein FtsW [Marinilabiliaceae bacterium]
MRALLDKHIRGDRIIWLLIGILAVFSLLAVYSSTGTLAYKYQGGNTMYYMMKHLAFLLAGLMVIVVVHKFSYTIFSRYAVVVLWVSIFLLMLTLVMGVSLNSASRWLTVPGIGISFQPSELAKFALMMFIARILSQHQEEGKPAAKAFKPIMMYVALVCGLIFRENLSTAAMLGLASMVLMFVGRVPFKYLLGSAAVALTVVALIIMLADHVPMLHRAKTWKARVERFIGNNDESSSKAEESEGDFQSKMSKMAVSTGGLFGKGPGNSYQRNFLPHPYSDFIYAIIIEEFGLFGGFVVMLIYMALLFRAAMLARDSATTFPAFLALGLTLVLVLQAFINMGVAVGVFPVTGQPLPLVSMGGTSTLFTCAAFGVILSVSRGVIEEGRNSKDGDKKGKTPKDTSQVETAYLDDHLGDEEE